MRRQHLFFSLFIACGVAGVLNTAAHAQPDPNNAPKADNPPNWNWNPGGGGGRGGMRPRMGFPMTAEQLKQLQAQQVEFRVSTIKQQLTLAGFTDDALQTAAVNEYKAQNTAQTELQEKWQKITAALRVNNTPAADMTAMLKDFRDAADKEKARRQTTSKALEAQFQVSQKPVLDALLMTMGITGDEAGLIGQTSAGGMGQIMNLFGGMRAGGGNMLPIPGGGLGNAQILGGGNGAAPAANGNARIFF